MPEKILQLFEVIESRISHVSGQAFHYCPSLDTQHTCDNV